MTNIIFVLHEVVISKQAYAQLLETLLSEQEITVFLLCFKQIIKIRQLYSIIDLLRLFSFIFRIGTNSGFLV